MEAEAVNGELDGLLPIRTLPFFPQCSVREPGSPTIEAEGHIVLWQGKPNWDFLHDSHGRVGSILREF